MENSANNTNAEPQASASFKMNSDGTTQVELNEVTDKITPLSKKIDFRLWVFREIFYANNHFVLLKTSIIKRSNMRTLIQDLLAPTRIRSAEIDLAVWWALKRTRRRPVDRVSIAPLVGFDVQIFECKNSLLINR